jgi:tRNA uridine 5-carboxymethylaminomethyl modification enzyme
VRWAAFCAKRDAIELELQRLRGLRVNPVKIANELIEPALGKPLERETTVFELLRRPDTTHAGLQQLAENAGLAEAVALAPEVVEQVEIQAKYQGYIDRQRDEVARQAAYETLALPESLDYTEVIGLSREVCQKLQTHRPQTLGQAARIQGVTPAAMGLLLVHLKRIGVALGAVL